MKFIIPWFSIFISIFMVTSVGFASGLVIESPWVRMPPPVSDTAAGYMILKNTASHEIFVESITSSVSETTEFHSMVMHKGMMHMNKMEDIAIKAGDSLVFDVGGNHLMLVDLKKVLKAGDKVTFNITTRDSVTHEINAEVRDMRKKSESMQHHH